MAKYISIILFALFSLSILSPATAQKQEELTVDQKIDNAMEPFSNAISEVIFWSPRFGFKNKVHAIKNGEKSVISSSNEPISIKNEGDSIVYGITYEIASRGEGFEVKYAHPDSPTTAQFSKKEQFGVPFSPFGKEDFKVTISKTEKYSTGGVFTIEQTENRIPFVLIWLIGGAIVFTFMMRFINLRGFKHAIQVVSGKFDNPDHKGEVSHFQALTAALSGTVGVGNIAGVALAVSLGGPGATFWMIIAGFLGMSSKFVECTLGVKYRKVDAEGNVSGGPMYYLSQGLKLQGKAGLGKVLAVLFAIACVGGSFGGGNMVQINQATQQLISVTGGDSSILANNGWIFGVFMAIVVGIIIIGGIKSIAKVTDKVVPFMVAIYVGAALIVIFANITEVPRAFGDIFGGAFSPDAMYGGLIGVLIVGFQRSAFSNEAGIGSASIAHSAAKTDEPISEGIVALLEPFIDTVVICTMTALVIIISGYGEFGATEAYTSIASGGNAAGIALTSSAFAETISWFPVVLAVAVILFALSTMISWSYYGLKAWTYMLGDSKATVTAYKILFCLLVVVGAAISANQVFAIGDAMIFAMCFPNVLGLYFLAPEIKKDLKDYFARVKSGEIKKFK